MDLIEYVELPSFERSRKEVCAPWHAPSAHILQAKTLAAGIRVQRRALLASAPPTT